MSYNVYFYSFTPGEHGQGHITRALAIRNALSRLGVLGDGSNQVQLHFCGIPDAPELWPDAKTMHVFTDSAGYERPQTASEIRETSTAICEFVEGLNPDLLLLDVNWKTLEPYLTNEAKRCDSWGLVRYKPNGLHGLAKRSVNRLYLIERVGFENWEHNSGLARERCRNELEKSGTYGPYHVPYNPEIYPTHLDWQKVVHKHDRKHIAPVVNLSREELFPREAAREYLTNRFQLDTRKPIALVIGRTRNFVNVDREPFSAWVEKTLTAKNYQVVYAGGVNVTDTAPDAHGYSYIPDLMRYVPSADLVLSHCGYNTFYGLRLLKQWGLYQGEVEFYPLANKTNDQTWRYTNSKEKFERGEWVAGLFSNNTTKYGTPQGNGADELAALIARKAGLKL